MTWHQIHIPLYRNLKYNVFQIPELIWQYSNILRAGATLSPYTYHGILIDPAATTGTRACKALHAGRLVLLNILAHMLLRYASRPPERERERASKPTSWGGTQQVQLSDIWPLPGSEPVLHPEWTSGYWGALPATRSLTFSNKLLPPVFSLPSTLISTHS